MSTSAASKRFNISIVRQSVSTSFTGSDPSSRRVNVNAQERDMLASSRFEIETNYKKDENFIQKTMAYLRKYSGLESSRNTKCNVNWVNSIYEDGCIMDVAIVEGDFEHGEVQYRLNRTVNKRKADEIKEIAKEEYDLIDIEESLKAFGGDLDYERDTTREDRYQNNRFASTLRNFLIWTHQSSVIKVFFIAVLQFIAFTMVFTFLILLSAAGNSRCLVNPNYPFSEWVFRERFVYAWTVSWTTFSTVGYGYANPTTPGDYMKENFYDGYTGGSTDMTAFREDDYCVLINLVCSMECLIGILFVGFWSAVMFARVHLYQMEAKVAFSSNIVMMHAPGGVAATSKSMRFLRMASGLEGKSDTVGKPCPVLVFRIVNQLHGHVEGEIMNAAINVVALINKDQVDPNTRMLAGHAIFGKAFSTVTEASDNGILTALAGITKQSPVTQKFMKKTKLVIAGKRMMDGAREEEETKLEESDSGDTSFSQPTYPTGATHEQMRKMDSRRKMLQQTKDPSMAMSKPQLLSVATNRGRVRDIMQQSFLDPTLKNEVEVYSTFKEDDSDAVPNMVYTKLNVTPDALPTFKRVWVVGHVLDEFSPLLTEEARQLVKENNGNWPKQLDSIHNLKQSVAFDSILVSFTGVPSVTAEDVFEQHVYDWDDTKFGYSFKSMLFRDPKGKVIVDDTAIDDVARTR